MADTESILQLGIEAARAGDKAEARELFRLVTREKPDNAQGWLWLAGVAEDREEKRTALENVMQLDPKNDLARKGLAAMGAATAGAVSTQGAAAKQPAATPVTSAAEPEAATPLAETPPGDSADSNDLLDAPTSDDNWTPTFAEDDFDLQDYQQTPRADADDEYDGGVVEEEERRGGIGWLPWVLGLIAIALFTYLAISFLMNRDNNVAQTPGTVESGVTAEAAASAIAGGVGDGTDPTTTGGEGGGLPIEGTSVPIDGSITAIPADQTVAPATDEPAPPSDQVPAEQTAQPPVDPGTPPEQATVIVVVPPDAPVVPPIAEVPTPVAAPPEAAPTEEVAPTNPPATGDVAAANPALVSVNTPVQAGAWTYTYPGFQSVIGEAFGNVPAPQGQYQIVIVNVTNGSGQPASIPDGFFVLKDAQGRIYPLNRAASVGYMDRFGRGQAADISVDDQAGPNILTSVGLVFDVAPDATSVVLLSPANVNQGFLVR